MLYYPFSVTATLLNSSIERYPIGVNKSYINLLRAEQHEILFLCFNSDIGFVPNMNHFVCSTSQWETFLQCNTISHWLCAYIEWSLSIGDKALPEQMQCHMTSLDPLPPGLPRRTRRFTVSPIAANWAITGYHVMACCLCGAKPLHEPMVAYCELDPCEQTLIKSGGGWGCEVSCGGHHRLRGKTTTGSALDGAVFDIAQILAYLVHNMSRSQSHLGFGHFGWLPSFFGQ